MDNPSYRASRYKRLINRRYAEYTLPLTATAVNFQKPEPVGVPVVIDEAANVSVEAMKAVTDAN